jgi:hypothetical protein
MMCVVGVAPKGRHLFAAMPGQCGLFLCACDRECQRIFLGAGQGRGQGQGIQQLLERGLIQALAVDAAPAFWFLVRWQQLQRPDAVPSQRLQQVEDVGGGQAIALPQPFANIGVVGGRLSK